MAGRTHNIRGYKVSGSPKGIEELQHKDDMVTRNLFMQAAENGSILFRGRRDEPYTIVRRSDYTFQVEEGEGEGMFSV